MLKMFKEKIMKLNVKWMSETEKLLRIGNKKGLEKYNSVQHELQKRYDHLWCYCG